MSVKAGSQLRVFDIKDGFEFEYTGFIIPFNISGFLAI